jgi:YbbR domain-containing protein
MGWITENLGLKLLSLLVAVLLWLATVGEPEIVTAQSVPIQYRNPPANLEISSQLTDSALVEMRGSSERLSDPTNAVVILDLGDNVRPGERTYSILEEHVKLPPGITFLRAVPSQIRLRLEYRVSREVPIVVRYSAPAPDGYKIGRQEVSPQLVRIVGPESRVNAIDKVQTDPIDLSPRDELQTFRVHPYAGDPQVRIERSDLMVSVKVDLEKIR